MTCRTIQAKALMASQLTPTPLDYARPVSPAVDALDELASCDPKIMSDSSQDMASSLTADETIVNLENNSSQDMTSPLTADETSVTLENSPSQHSGMITSTPIRDVNKSRVSPVEESETTNTPLSPVPVNCNSELDSKTGKGSTSSSQTDSPQTFHSVTPDVPSDGGAGDGDFTASHNSGTQTDDDSLHETLKVPIFGYEVMEERSRFTVFKIQVRKSDFESWLIFRRYTDFVRLNDKLREIFPHFRLALPPKRWFGDNFDRSFLDDRLLGLQAFLNNVAGHKDVVNSNPVKRFFCLDDPPGPHDSLEESRALCESLEEVNYSLQKELEEKEARISLLQEELSLQRKEIDNLKKALKVGRAERRRGSQQSELSINDTSALIEADQQRYSNTDWSEVPVVRRSPVKERLYADNRLSLGNVSVGSMDIVPEEDRHSLNIDTKDPEPHSKLEAEKAVSNNIVKKPATVSGTCANTKTDLHFHLNSDSKSMTSSQSGDSILILDHESGAPRLENRNLKDGM